MRIERRNLMALFTKKTWKNRMSEYPTRRRLTKENGTTELVTVARSEGTVSQEGDAFSADNMNNLEDRILRAIGTGDIPKELGADIVSAINALNTGISSVEVYKYNISTAMGTNPAYVSNDFEAKNTATAMLKPVSSGVQILKPGIYIVIARFIISSTSSGSRVGYGIREFKSASDYMDSMDNTSSASSRTDTYIYIRITKSYDAGTYLRPIAAVPNGGICAGCSLIVLSLK